VTVRSESTFRRVAVVALAYTIFVILWGAIVRITGSGAGCGQHWPTCHGDIIPQAPTIETLIEFGHRLTSGICVLVILAGAIIATKTYPRGSATRKLAWWGFFFIILESLIGAALVLLEYVALDDSPLRAVWMAGHLLNTFVLSAVMLATIWSAYGWSISLARLRSRSLIAVQLLCVGVLLTSMMGAITALGDTLFPIDVASTTIVERIRGEQDGVTHFLMQLRIIHPVLSCLVVLALVVVPLQSMSPSRPREYKWSIVVASLGASQLVIGLLNIYLSAPGWMQVVHLATALGLWLSLCWLWFSAAAERSEA
jgi:cytochrome c oxidase assembly protein subunit 15